MEKVLVAYAHSCPVPQAGNENHKHLERIALLFKEGTTLPDEIKCLTCDQKVKKGTVTHGFYSEKTA